MTPRRSLGAGLLLAGLLVATAAWTDHQARSARSALLDAKAAVSDLESRVRDQHLDGVDSVLTRIRRDTDRAHRDTTGPVWALATHLPGRAGRIATTTRGLAVSLDVVARDALPGLVRSAEKLSSAGLVTDGRIDLAGLRSASASVTRAAATVDRQSEQVAGLPTGTVASLDEARGQLLTTMRRVRGSLDGSARTLQVLPAMLGGSGARRYFLAFQNPAESRGTGGLIGAYGLLKADDGKVVLTKTGSDVDFDQNTDVPVDTGDPGYRETWEDGYGARYEYFSANYTGSFPSAAQVWRARWAKQSRQPPVDGVLAIDPFALGSLLGSRTVTLSSGEAVPGAQLGTYVTQTLPVEYQDRDAQRKALLLEVAQKAFSTIVNGGAGAPGLLTGLRDAVSQGRIEAWSSHPEEQAVLAASIVGAEMPQGPGPFAWAAALNAAGNKADVFLDRSVSYTTGPCPTGGETTRDSTIAVTLTNHVPTNAPRIQGGRFDDPSPPVPPLQHHVMLATYAAQDAVLLDATVSTGGAKAVATGVEPDVERGHALFIANLELPRDVPVTLTLHLREPAAGPQRSFRPQPLLRPQTTTTSVATCP